MDRPAAAEEADGGVRGMGMPMDVRQSFLDHAVEGDLGGAPTDFHVAVDIERNRQPGPLAKSFDQRPDRFVQSHFVEHGRMREIRDGAKLALRLAQQLLHLGDDFDRRLV